MEIKLLLKTVFLAACFCISEVSAQMTCTSTNFKDVTVMNTNGGTNPSNGLRIQISGAGNLQVFKEDEYQIYAGDISGTNPNNVPGTTNGVLLTIGNSIYATGTLDADASFFNKTILQPTLSTCNTTGNTYTHQIAFSITKNSLVYTLALTYSYTYPNSYFTIKYDVIIPPGNLEAVKLSQGWDTYLAGGDRGPGFVSGTGSNLTMGTQKLVDGTVVYEAFKYKSGKAWDGYYSARYAEMNSNLKNNGYIFNKTIDRGDVDNGIGISINYGSAPGTFSTTNDVIFNCNAPTTAPAFASTNLTLACGSTINLKSGYTGTAESALPAGVTLGFYDAQGNKITNPTAVSNPGTYTVYYSDANNAGCTSPSTTLVVAGGNCCSTTPVLTSNTITNTCPAETVNLNSLFTGTLPSGVVLEWYTNNTHTGSPVATPTAVAAAGTYYAFIRDTATSCFSPASAAVTFTKTDCCTAGMVAPVIN